MVSESMQNISNVNCMCVRVCRVGCKRKKSLGNGLFCHTPAPTVFSAMAREAAKYRTYYLLDSTQNATKFTNSPKLGILSSSIPELHLFAHGEKLIPANVYMHAYKWS